MVVLNLQANAHSRIKFIIDSVQISRTANSLKYKKGFIMELKFLGRGSAFNTKEGNTSAYIKENGTLFLIDCGSNIFERIISKHIFDDINNVYVVITHRHPDHIGSLGDLIFYCYYVKNIKVNIIENEDDPKSICKYLLLNGVAKDKYKVWEHTYIPELNFMFYFEETDHCQIFKNYRNYGEENFEEENIFPCYSVILKFDNGKSIFYSGDTTSVDFGTHDFEDEYYIDCCIAYYDGNVHYNIDKLYNNCNENGISPDKIWCMHFDNDKAIKRAKELGFNVVTVE